MDLQLVEYNRRTRKYLDHLDLGDMFLFGGNYVRVYPRNILQVLFRSIICTENTYKYYLDEKDPYNRFKGRFDGRTYGKGRFVLVRNREDDIYEISNSLNSTPRRVLLGNIHLVPQLWEKTL